MKARMKSPGLVMLPSVPVWRDGQRLTFDRKFYDGMLLQVKCWPGEIRCAMSAGNSEPPSFGLVSKSPDELPFQCVVRQDKESITGAHLDGAAVVLGAGDMFDQFHVARLCQANGAACIYAIEYTLETRYQIAAMSTNNPVVKLRRYFFLWNGERKRRAAFALADGLQINGTAAYEQYGHFNKPLLYFDTRVQTDVILSDDQLEGRLQQLGKGGPLRLAFSGRLVRMKGADHLVELARRLKQRNVDFRMTIYGAGDLDAELEGFVERHGLRDVVDLPGSVDFYERLLPEIKQDVDVFVMLHRQSDPSCTYLETLSCGVPIVGYTNRAFAGLLELADVGWGAEMDDIEAVADIIQRLAARREEIANKSQTAVQFARLHDFETTFQKRMDHLASFVK